MNTNLFFNFQVDKSSKKVFITRDFNAPLDLVWDAFTKAELLDQWTAPAPYMAKTKYMDFSVGGKRFYAMISPDGSESWALQKYTSISPKTHFQFFNTFTDKDENPAPTGSEWDHTFSHKDGMTRVHITIYNESLERMEGLLDGFKEGYTASIANLENLLSSQMSQ